MEASLHLEKDKPMTDLFDFSIDKMQLRDLGKR
jgi:hypothetical protein